MKHGRTLPELAAEIKRQSEAKADYLAPISQVEMVQTEYGNEIVIDTVGSFGILETAHRQISAYTDIPYKYYERLMGTTGLLADNVNYWLGHYDGGDKRMLRTLDGHLRAFLSDKYRRIDNQEVATAVLPIISQMQGAEVKSCEVTDDKMYLKVVNPRLQTEVVKGDVVQAGIIISNSEVGLGSVSVSPLIYRLVCKNGMIAQDNSVKKYHVGRANESDVNLGIYRDETVAADDRAFMMKLQDTVLAAVEEAIFAKIVDKMREAKDAKIEARSVQKVVELTSRHVGITQYEEKDILGYLIEGGDLSLYGFGNAVTQYAQTVKSYDRSTELEATGYKVMTLEPRIFNSIASAARD